MKPRRCTTCTQVKDPGDFPKSQAKRCLSCWQAARTEPCANCGKPAGFKADNYTVRLYCTSPKCTAAKHRANAIEYRAKKSAEAAAKTAHTCPSCLKTKQLTEEFWSPLVRSAEGVVERFDSYCRSCRYALQRDRYRSDEATRDDALARAAERRAEENRRREADAEFDRVVRERRRRHSEAARKRLRAPQENLPARARTDAADFPALPALPLAHAVLAEASKIEATSMTDNGQRRELIAEAIGVSARTLFAWESGERGTVQFDIADRVLLALDLFWWDVWPDDLTARRAFEGEEAQAA